jgi:hypothetical protein
MGFLAAGDGVADEVTGFIKLREGFFEVDDRHAVAVIVDEFFSARIEAAQLVPEVYSGVVKFLQGGRHMFLEGRYP